jgi:hypothetical protein
MKNKLLKRYRSRRVWELLRIGFDTYLRDPDFFDDKAEGENSKNRRLKRERCPLG